MRLSYWEEQSLLGNPDVVIIGAGIVGLTAARIVATANPMLSVTVLEGQSIGALASSRNAGFACFGSVSELISDIKTYGEEQVLDLVLLRRKGLGELIKFAGPEVLEYKEVGGYEVFRDKTSFERYEVQVEYLNQLIGEEIFDISDVTSPLRFHPQAIRNRLEGHLNTGKMYNHLYQSASKAGVKILNGISISQIDYTDQGVNLSLSGIDTKVQSKKVLITTNALAKDLIEELDVVPCRNQVIITEPIPHHGIRGTFHLDEGYVYFRDVGDRILIGGARHLFKDENTRNLGNNEENIVYLQEILRNHILPDQLDFSISNAWSGLLSGGDNRLPIVRNINKNVSVAVRLGGMGVAIGSIIGAQLATLALD